MDQIIKIAHKINKKWKSMFIVSKLLFVVATVKVLVVLGISIATVAAEQLCVNTDTPEQKVEVCPTYWVVNQAVVYALWAIFFFVNIFDGIFNDNLYELYSAMFQALFLTGWSIFRFAQPFPNGSIEYTFLITCCTAQLFYIIVAFRLHRAFVWNLFKKAGADKDFRKIYKIYLVWLTFLKLDSLYGLCSAILSGKGVYNTGIYLVFDILMILYIIGFFILGYVSVNRELYGMIMLWIILLIVSPAYLLFYLYDAWTFNSGPEANYASRRLGFLFSASAIVSLISRIILSILTYFVYNNFGKGFKKLEYLGKFDSDDERNTENAENNNEYTSMDQVGDDITVFDVIRNTHAVKQTENLP